MKVNLKIFKVLRVFRKSGMVNLHHSAKRGMVNVHILVFQQVNLVLMKVALMTLV